MNRANWRKTIQIVCIILAIAFFAGSYLSRHQRIQPLWIFVASTICICGGFASALGFINEKRPNKQLLFLIVWLLTALGSTIWLCLELAAQAIAKQ